MILGTSQLDITPKPGVELSGFAARTQPSTGVLDPFLPRRFISCVTRPSCYGFIAT